MKRIFALMRPGNSPDLNSVENCWRVISFAIAKGKPGGKTELRGCLLFGHLEKGVVHKANNFLSSIKLSFAKKNG